MVGRDLDAVALHDHRQQDLRFRQCKLVADAQAWAAAEWEVGTCRAPSWILTLRLRFESIILSNMTRMVSAADAKTHFSDHLRASERGESIVITRHGKPIAALVPARDLPDLERLRAAGPGAGLASVAGGWPGSGTLVKRVRGLVRSGARRVPRPR